MTMGNTCANGGVARFVVVGALFAAAVAGILARPMKGTPSQPSGRPIAPRAGVAAGGARTPVAVFAKMYGELPLRFEANLGQTDSQVKFISRGADSALFLTATDAVLTLDQSSENDDRSQNPTSSTKLLREMPAQLAKRSRVALRMSLEDANRSAEVRGLEPLPGKSNYFIGNDPRH